MKVLVVASVLLSNAYLAAAAIGGACTYNGLRGTCQKTSNCRNGMTSSPANKYTKLTKFVAAFTVNNYCPNDPADVKCCISQSCRRSSGATGMCMNNPGSSCSGSWATGLCPGPNNVQCCISGGSSPPPASTQIDVTFWLKSFIPLNFEKVTKPWPNHSGKTMLNGLPESLEWVPNFGGCFVTDQRGFSSNQYASARMHSEAAVTISSSAYRWSQTHRCGLTVKVDCDNGNERDRATAGTGNMKYSLVSGSNNRVVLKYSGQASDPLVTGAPRIDIEGTLTVDRVSRYVEFSGKVDDFPSFEAYFMVNGRGPYRIGSLDPKPGSNAASLLGGANRGFSGRVSF